MDKQLLVDKLNGDLAEELSAVSQYLVYASKVNGPYRPQLYDFLMKEVPDETGHAEYLANKIVALGGEPTTQPAPVAPARNNKEMLEAVREAEGRAVRNYTERARQAGEFGDKGLQVRLEDMVSDETTHYEETGRILREWNL